MYALDGMSDADRICLPQARVSYCLHAQRDSLPRLRRFGSLAASMTRPPGDDSSSLDTEGVDDFLAAMSSGGDARQEGQET